MGETTLVAVPRSAPWQRMEHATPVTECLSEGGVEWTVISVDEQEYLAWLASIEDDKIIDRMEAVLAAPVPRANKNGDIFDQPLRPTRMFMNEADWNDIVKFGKEG